MIKVHGELGFASVQMSSMGNHAEPLVILIGGVPGTGKTTVASRVAGDRRVKHVFGGDLLREFLRGVIPRDKLPVLFESVYNCWKLVSSERSPEAIVEGFKLQSEIMNGGVASMVKRSLSDGESLILEYIHLVPEQLRDVLARESVFPFLLYAADEGNHRRNLLAREADTHTRSHGQRLVEALPVYRIIQDYLKTQAERFGVSMYATDSGTLDDATARLLTVLPKENPYF